MFGRSVVAIAKYQAYDSAYVIRIKTFFISQLQSTMPNRLTNETSPYLLQHKDNPVEWYPWCEEALERSRTEDKPIFLSIGYSACHWCHVMEHESFEDEDLARVLNENFICIKVDREERPDLDQIYMNAVMALQQGRGGWPLNVFLTPDQHVFFGGTYWPPRTRVGMPGFDQVLHGVLDAYTSRRDSVEEQSQKVTQWINQNASVSESDSDAGLKKDEELLRAAVQTLQRSFDDKNGGFGSAPKFPHCMDLSLLVQIANASNENSTPNRERLLEMVRVSLKKMAYGGIFDHLAGGFARYSVDEHWLVPHFEKMLYDNALLVSVYLDMYKTTGDQFYSMIARKTLNYLLNYMIDAEGGIHSTEDADSEGVEGKFYVWSKSEILEVLGNEAGERFCKLYNVTEAGNFEGENILNMQQSYQDFADSEGIAKQELRDEMREAREKLLAVRDRRIRPGKDDKILVSWNALAISAFARAAILLDDPQYAIAAERSARFIHAKLRQPDGRLLHTCRGGTAKLAAYLDDYSYLVNALVDVYQTSFDPIWLDWASELSEMMVKHFWDSDQLGFYFTADDHEQLISRVKPFQDSSVPSGNAMAATALIRLGKITGNQDWSEKAEQTINASLAMLNRSPLSSGQMLLALERQLAQSFELVLMLPESTESKTPLASKILQRCPAKTSLVVSHESAEPSVLSEYLDGKKVIGDQPTLYICSDHKCSAPVVGQQAILDAVNELTRNLSAFSQGF